MNDLLNVIHKLGDKPKRVILFGHNPELTEFANRLSSEITHMPTCAVAKFTFNAKSWSHLGKAKLAKVMLDRSVRRTTFARGRGQNAAVFVGTFETEPHWLRSAFSGCTGKNSRGE